MKAKPKEKLWIDGETKEVKDRIARSGYAEKIKRNMVLIYDSFGTEIFGNSQIVQVLHCSEVTATTYIRRLHEELQLIAPVSGQGKGKYKFL